MANASGGNTGRWVLVLGLAFVTALGLTVLIFRQSERTVSSAAPLPSGLGGGRSARQAYPQALEVAQGWQPDSKPALVSTQWRLREGRWPVRVVWTFQFYSPSTQRLAVVAVDESGARMLRETLSPYRVPTFADADWQVDSPAAVEAWWNGDGATLVSLHSESDVEVTAQLRANEGGNPIWTVTGITASQVRTVSLDGKTGELLDN